MSDDKLIADQLDFFARNLSGCAFAVMAARDPGKFEWCHRIYRASDPKSLDDIVNDAMKTEGLSTLSVVLPEIKSDDDLDEFLPSLNSEAIFLYEKVDTANNRCFRYRAKVGGDESFVSGFGPFDYMPKTRRTPHTALVMRVKPRPAYDWHLKEPTEGVIHVADMDMKGTPDRTLARMWRNSFLRTAGILGKKPDDESAAKTTFVVPLARAQKISL